MAPHKRGLIRDVVSARDSRPAPPGCFPKLGPFVVVDCSGACNTAQVAGKTASVTFRESCASRQTTAPVQKVEQSSNAEANAHRTFENKNENVSGRYTKYGMR